MSQDRTRQEEFRIDGQEIKDRVRGALHPQRTETQEFHDKGDQVAAKIKDVLHAGNVRRISVRGASGRTLIDIPLTMGIVGALVLPMWTGIGAIAALALDCTITVEKTIE